MSAPSSPILITDSLLDSETQDYAQPPPPSDDFIIDAVETDQDDQMDKEGDGSQEDEEIANEDAEGGEEGITGVESQTDTKNTSKKPRERKAPLALEREPGKSFFPVSRVQKILKADNVGLSIYFILIVTPFNADSIIC